MKKRIKKILSMTIIGALLVGTVIGLVPVCLEQGRFAFADTTKSYQDQIDAAKKKKEELEKAQKELEAKLAQLKAKKEICS